jgi:hypothetical protein
MDDNLFWLRFWQTFAVVVIVISLCITTYCVVDRVGPQRPIVTQSTQYQAK